MQFHFSNHLLDVSLRELSRAGEPIPVEPQVFDLLIYLLPTATMSSARMI